MARGFCAAILISVAVAFVAGCALSEPAVIPREKAQLYSVELEFKLIRTEPAAPAAEAVPVQPAEEALPSEAPLDDSDSDEAMPLIEPPAPDSDSDVAPAEEHETTPDEAEPEGDETEPEPAPEESTETAPMPEPAKPEETRPATKETVVYAVQQTLKVGNQIDIKRVEVVKFMEEISDVMVEVEGNRMFAIEGKTRQIPGTDDFELSILLTFKDERMKLNFSCEASTILSTLNDSEQVIATIGDLKLVLICRNLKKIEYEK